MFLRWILGIPDFAISFNILFDMSDVKIIGSLGDGLNQRWAGPVRACLRWESANLWCTQSSLLCNLLQQGRLLGAGSGKSDIQVPVGKRCSCILGFHSSRVGCAGKKQWKTEEFEGEREEVSYVRGGVLLEMGNSNPRRPYGNLERGHFSDVRALSSRKLGTSKFKEKYGKQLAFSPHFTPCWLSASVRCLACVLPEA